MSEMDTPTPSLEEKDWETLESASQKSDTPNKHQERDGEPKNLADAIVIIEQLRQDKRQLQERVWDLEATLNRIEHGRDSQESTTSLTSETLNNNGVHPEQSLVEKIRAKLQACEHQMARMEREFALTQQRYNEQTYQLQQSEQNSQELRSRLNRQQRYTLQFKAALEKCLEEVRDRNFATSDAGESIEPMYFAPAQPVEPWSIHGMEVEAAPTEEMPSATPTPDPSEAIPIASKPVVSDLDDQDLERQDFDLQESGILDDREEDDRENPEEETDENAKIPEADATPPVTDPSPPDTNTSAIAQPSILPPELANPKRQPISKVDLPTFPPLNE